MAAAGHQGLADRRRIQAVVSLWLGVSTERRSPDPAR